jgi:hypothetical protein
VQEPRDGPVLVAAEMQHRRRGATEVVMYGTSDPLRLWVPCSRNASAIASANLGVSWVGVRSMVRFSRAG